MKDQICHLRPSDLGFIEKAITHLVCYQPQHLPAALDLAHRLHMEDFEKRLHLAVLYYREKQGKLQLPPDEDVKLPCQEGDFA